MRLLHRRHWPPHGDPSCGIESTTSLILQNRSQRRAECGRWNFLETEARIEGHVPWDVPEGGQRHGSIATLLGPTAHLRYEPPTKTSTTVIRMDVDLL